jgi:hypothetical protein
MSYVFSRLREGDVALYRGAGNGLATILLVAAEETSLGGVERLEREDALKAELDAGWAARPVALTRYNDRITLVLEDPGGVTVEQLLGRPLGVSHFLRIALPLAGVLLRSPQRQGLLSLLGRRRKGEAARQANQAGRSHRPHWRTRQKLPARKGAFDINGTILDTIALTRRGDTAE